MAIRYSHEWAAYKLRDSGCPSSGFKRIFTRFVIVIAVVCAFSPYIHSQNVDSAKPTPDHIVTKFLHPGILHTAADLERIKLKVKAGEEPWKSGFDLFRNSKFAQFDYKMRGPFDYAGRNPIGHTKEITDDSIAAYQNAIMWAVTGEARHARKAAEILNAWSSTLKHFSEDKDTILAAGTFGFLFTNAAEILRYTYPEWKSSDVVPCQAMLHDVFYPVMKDFATFANGNWDAFCIRGLMAIGVFCDDPAMFKSAADYYRNGSGNGRLTHYVINDAGQCQESGRDQAHTQLGLGLLCDACQIAWNQGLDLYSDENNRLLKGFEYTARYNLGNDVPFTAFVDTTGKYRQKMISGEKRGVFRSIYELAWNHYNQIGGMEMPFSEQVLLKIRPEGAANLADNCGYGTLLFSLKAKEPK